MIAQVVAVLILLGVATAAFLTGKKLMQEEKQTRSRAEKEEQSSWERMREMGALARKRAEESAAVEDERMFWEKAALEALHQFPGPMEASVASAASAALVADCLLEERKRRFE